jgi:hypothetical protein
MNPSMPDITKAQIAAFAQGAIALGASFGFQMSQAHSIELLSLSGVGAVALMWVDAHIRRGRALALAAHNGGYSFKTALEDDLLGAAPPAPVDSAPAAPDMAAAVAAAAPVIVDPAPADPAAPPAPAVIGQ